MASKKDKKAGATLLPKQLAGVKIPKGLRRNAHHLAALAKHPMVVDLIAAGLVALAAGLRGDSKQAAQPAKGTDDAAPEASAEAMPAVEPAKATPKPRKPRAPKPAAAAATPAKSTAKPRAPKKATPPAADGTARPRRPRARPTTH